MIFEIPYPPTKRGKAAWNKRFGLNAYYAGKHWSNRKRDAEELHSLALRSMKKAHIRKQFVKGPCQDCAYPIIDCSWLHEGKPVPGWKAKLKTRPNGRNSDGSKHWFTTYAIEYCPRYIQIPPRESSPAALTREQDKWFMERNKGK